MEPIAPNLVDRLFLLLDGLQGPSSMNLHALTLSKPLDPAVLGQALAALLDEQPLLHTRVTRTRWGFRRAVLPPSRDVVQACWVQAADDDAAVAFDSATERAFMRHRVDLTAEGPFRILTRPHPLGARLVIGLHHSVADGVGGYWLVDRLAEHYTAVAEGRPPASLSPPPPRSYGVMFNRLPWRERVRAVWGAVTGFRELVAPTLVCATFGDQPLPAWGDFSWREVALPPEALPPLKARAKALGCTLNDMLLAAVANAGAATWPNPESLPLQVMVPVSLRDGAAIDPSNRVAELRFAIPAERVGDVTDTVAFVKGWTPLARDRARAFSLLCQNALASYLPPGLIRHVITEGLSTPVNHTLTFVFSNVGVLNPQPRDFGPAQLLAIGGHPPLTMPPGLGVVATTVQGTLFFTIAWTDPAVSEGSIARFSQQLLRFCAVESPTP